MRHRRAWCPGDDRPGRDRHQHRPGTAEQVTVGVDTVGGLDVDPPGAVVLFARVGGGTLAGSCCSVMDFHADPARAREALRVPGTTGTVLTVSEAHALGVTLFARLPAPSPP